MSWDMAGVVVCRGGDGGTSDCGQCDVTLRSPMATRHIIVRQKIPMITKLMHTCSHVITPPTEQNAKLEWRQGLAINIVYITLISVLMKIFMLIIATLLC